jgi:hypothetical protein
MIGILPQERHDDLDRLLEAPEHVVLGQPEGVGLAAGMPGAEAQHESAATDLVEGLDRLCRDARVPVEGRQDPRANLHA